MAYIIVNAIAGILLVLSLIKDRKRTVKALSAAWQIAKQMVPLVAIIWLAIGLVIGFSPSGSLSRLLNSDLGFLAIPIMAVIGSFLALPAPVVFPLAASMLKATSHAGSGPGMVGIAAIAALVTCNSMVSFASFPIEIAIMGSRSTTVRLVSAFIAAVTIAVLMGVILHGYHA